VSSRLAESARAWHDARVVWGQVTTVIAALATITGMQAFWVSRALDRVYAALDRVDVRLDRVETTLDRIEKIGLREQGERIARLETARGS